MNPYAEIDTVDPRRIVVRIPFTAKDLIKQLPGSTWSHKDQAWKLPLGWSACITLRAVFGQDLEIGPNLTGWAREQYERRIGPALALRDEVERDGDPTLYPFQRAGVAFLNIAERALLADEMGSGKSIQTIKALQLMHLNGKNPFPVLIVCPNSMKTTWKREAEKWWPGLKFLPVSGSAAKRREILETPAHGYIMNIESLRSHTRLAPYGSISLKRCKECGGEDQRITTNQCEVHPRELNQLKFQTVVADECFVGGTLIDTPDGVQPIEELQVGDTVWGYDHETDRVVATRVVDTQRRSTKAVISDLGVTPNHPYFAVGQGYLPVGDLEPSDEVVRIGSVPAVSPGVLQEPTVSQVLFGSLRGSVQLQDSERSRIPVSHYDGDNVDRVVEDAARSSVSERASVDTRAQSQESRSYSSRKAVSTRLPNADQGLIGSASYPAGGGSSLVSYDDGVGVGAWTGTPRQADSALLLPIGSSASRDSGLRGSRRAVASFDEAESVRRAENSAAGGAGVDHLEIHEPRDRQRYDRVCRESGVSRPIEVYNLTTAAGNYFANSVLVHNCHRAKDPKAKQTRALWAATGDAPYRFALTGTPIANAPDDLWPIMHWLDPQQFPSRTRWIDRFCTPPDSPVLMADCTVKQIGDVKIGDLVAGFPRENIPGKLQLKPTHVTAVNRHVADLVRVTTASGRSFLCTPDHRWLDARRYFKSTEERGTHGVGASEYMRNRDYWGACSCGFSSNAGNWATHRKKCTATIEREPSKLPEKTSAEKRAWRQERGIGERASMRTFSEPYVGMRMVPIHEVPEVLSAEDQALAHWLGGMYDGEGSLFGIAQTRAANPDVYYRTEHALKTLGIPFRQTETGFAFQGGRNTWIRFATYCQPWKRHAIATGERYGDWNPLKRGGALHGIGRHGYDEIVSVEPAGSGEVVSLTTELHTYVVHGMASHNCEVMYNAFGSPTVIGIKPEREQEFQAIVNPMMRRMPKSLVLPFLPPVVRVRREVEMSPKQAKAYKQMSEQMIAELEDGDILLASSPLVKATRLIQFSSAFAELETKTDQFGNQEIQVHLSDPSCKIDAFMDDLPDLEGKSVVVFAQSRQLIDLLSERLSKQKKPIPHGLITGGQTPDERQGHMDDFQTGKTKLILCTIQAGGTGITLTQGSVAVFLQRSWSLVDTLQAEARIHRIGSEIHESVTIVDYVTTGTIEEYQIAAVGQKSDRLEAIVRDADLLKRVLLKENIDKDSEVTTA